MDRLRAIVDFGHKQQKDEAGLRLLRLFSHYSPALCHFPASYLLLGDIYKTSGGTESLHSRTGHNLLPQSVT
ncbi:hypothetical protein J2T16_003016 [Paenibacillus intestini]|uniref:Uncharacterized protein n=1 Tax=Paenibacillus cucumis (ex Kampfer et al. 2016) TaxID=1776858 RepID=A0ABS7KD53_9BACL|nr:hypothetical protein [Paenibacillus cucumis (ex Kampfer et al. 2016)]MBY0202068.1 hypothetical protein [Paenibacillus cucumis (ex Kampfer et al. 2016)]MDP9700111.1 hypothetical protein [Paenibacillus intestini]